MAKAEKKAEGVQQELGGPGSSQQEPHAVKVFEEPRPPAAVAVAGDTDNLIQLAIEKDLDIGKLERLIALRDKERAEAAERAFLNAMAQFQAECPTIPKTGKGKTVTDKGTFEYGFPELDVIAQTIRPLATALGFSWGWSSRQETAELVVTLTIYHKAGHSRSNEARIPIATRAGMSDQQKVSNARSFGARLSLIDGFGITSGIPDRDGADPTTISAEQAEGIRADLEEVAAKLPKFLALMNVEKIADIRLSHYPIAQNAINGYRQAKAARAAAQSA